MKVVLFLSGRRSTEQFHTEQDSIADSVAVPAELQTEFENLLEMYQAVTVKDNLLPTVCMDSLMDMLSDCSENSPAWELLYTNMEQLSMSECSCGIYHFLK